MSASILGKYYKDERDERRVFKMIVAYRTVFGVAYDLSLKYAQWEMQVNHFWKDLLNIKVILSFNEENSSS